MSSSSVPFRLVMSINWPMRRCGRFVIRVPHETPGVPIHDVIRQPRPRGNSRGPPALQIEDRNILRQCTLFVGKGYFLVASLRLVVIVSDQIDAAFFVDDLKAAVKINVIRMVLIDNFHHFGLPNILKSGSRRKRGMGSIPMIVKRGSRGVWPVKAGVFGIACINGLVGCGIPSPEPLVMKCGEKLQTFGAHGTAQFPYHIAAAGPSGRHSIRSPWSPIEKSRQRVP